MSDEFDIRIEIDSEIPNLTVIIKNNELNKDVEGVMAAVQEYAENRIPNIPAFQKDSMVILPQPQIIRFFIDGRKVMAQTRQGLYEVRKPLKEIEDMLDETVFVRISKSEIVNLSMVKNFDFSINGTIGVLLVNGEKTYVARRRVKEVKWILMGRK